MTERIPEPGDIVLIDNDRHVTRVDGEVKVMGSNLFEITDSSGKMFYVESAPDRDDGKQVVWRHASLFGRTF